MPTLLDKIDATRVPAHVAIIMDGNGRWAKERSMERSAGHVEGVNTVRLITEAASEAGVKYLTLYAFYRKLESPADRGRCPDASYSDSH